MLKSLLRWFHRNTTPEVPQDDPCFSVARRAPLDSLVSFWVDDSLYEDIRSFAGERDASRFLRASLRLGLGVFQECPELLRRLDTRGRKKHSMSFWLDEATSGRLLVISQNQQSRLIRASVEVGLILFRAHPDLIPTLDGEQTE